MENETKQAYNILSQALFANNIDRNKEFSSSERDIFGGFRKALHKLEKCFDIQMLDAHSNKINVRNFLENKFFCTSYFRVSYISDSIQLYSLYSIIATKSLHLKSTKQHLFFP